MSITVIWYSAARQTSGQTHSDLRLKKMNYALIHLSAPTIRETTRQTVTIVYSGNIGSIVNDTTRSHKSSEKSELTQFAHLWAEIKYDFKNPKYFLIKCLQEQTSNRYFTRKQ